MGLLEKEERGEKREERRKTEAERGEILSFFFHLTSFV